MWTSPTHNWVWATWDDSHSSAFWILLSPLKAELVERATVCEKKGVGQLNQERWVLVILLVQEETGELHFSYVFSQA